MDKSAHLPISISEEVMGIFENWYSDEEKKIKEGRAEELLVWEKRGDKYHLDVSLVSRTHSSLAARLGETR